MQLWSRWVDRLLQRQSKWVQLQRKSPCTDSVGILVFLMLNQNVGHHVVCLHSTSARAPELLTSLLPLSMSHQWTRAPLKPSSSGSSPNYRTLCGLLFISVKALTPYCAVVSWWIQHTALLCRPQLFYDWGLRFRANLSNLSGWSVCFCLLCVCVQFEFSFCMLIALLFLFGSFVASFLCFCCIEIRPPKWLSICLLTCILGITYCSCFGHKLKPPPKAFSLTFVYTCGICCYSCIGIKSFLSGLRIYRAHGALFCMGLSVMAVVSSCIFILSYMGLVQ